MGKATLAVRPEKVILTVVRRRSKLAFEFKGNAFTFLPESVVRGGIGTTIKVFRGEKLFDQALVGYDTKNCTTMWQGFKFIRPLYSTPPFNEPFQRFKGLWGCHFVVGDRVELESESKENGGFAERLKSEWANKIWDNPRYRYRGAVRKMERAYKKRHGVEGPAVFSKPYQALWRKAHNEPMPQLVQFSPRR
jgi:hypothetical protein